MQEGRIEYLDPSEIKPDPNQPRQTWTEEDKEEIQGMVDSLEEHGVIEPIEIDENNVIVLGERRWKACAIAGVKVPTRRKTGLTPAQRLERQIISDSQRKDLSPIDRAWAYATAIANINTGKNYTVKNLKSIKNLITLLDLGPGRGLKSGQAELSRRIGISQMTISNHLKVLGLKPEIQEAIEKKQLPMTIAREIKRLPTEKLQRILQNRIAGDLKTGKKPKRDEISEVVSFVNEPKLELPTSEETIVIELDEKAVEQLLKKEITPTQIRHKEISKRLQPPPEVQEKIRESIKATEEQAKKLLEIPEVRERGKWYANWLAHGAIVQALSGAFCPVCGAGSENLGWLCHSISLNEACQKVTEEYQKRVK